MTWQFFTAYYVDFIFDHFDVLDNETKQDIRVIVDPISGGGISPVVCLHNAAVFFVCVVAGLLSCGWLAEVGEGGTTTPPTPTPPPLAVVIEFCRLKMSRYCFKETKMSRVLCVCGL